MLELQLHPAEPDPVADLHPVAGEPLGLGADAGVGGDQGEPVEVRGAGQVGAELLGQVQALSGVPAGRVEPAAAALELGEMQTGGLALVIVAPGRRTGASPLERLRGRVEVVGVAPPALEGEAGTPPRVEPDSCSASAAARSSSGAGSARPRGAARLATCASASASRARSPSSCASRAASRRSRRPPRTRAGRPGTRRGRPGPGRAGGRRRRPPRAPGAGARRPSRRDGPRATRGSGARRRGRAPPAARPRSAAG
jgi:hypothetical protein